MSSTGGVSPLSLLTFFAAAKKVSAAPHRGNARAARRNADASGKQGKPQKKGRRRPFRQKSKL
ncbi:hypothetical protein GCT13_10560 [Paraburkholderia sp. CNPSo 3157]|uniref:Uncharacterized protein n=1 Tax=Paraburkholderia franconis TaxID=2654983 RepID=A0A7X1N9A7_9BURK|nr:hypothetical protein [Paraburkholderia franconis]